GHERQQREPDEQSAARDQGEADQLVGDAVGDGVPPGVGDRGDQDGRGDRRGHAARSRTSTRVPPAWATSVLGSIGKTVYGVPAAAHTRSCSRRERSARTRVVAVRWPNGGTPPMA